MSDEMTLQQAVINLFAEHGCADVTDDREYKRFRYVVSDHESEKVAWDQVRAALLAAPQDELDDAPGYDESDNDPHEWLVPHGDIPHDKD